MGMTERSESARRFARSALMIAISVGIIIGVFRLATAGSLNPPTDTTTGTLSSLASISDALFGTFDSSGITADPDGSALQVAKCIITRMNGGTCP
jgi:hypothetical protein